MSGGRGEGRRRGREGGGGREREGARGRREREKTGRERRERGEVRGEKWRVEVREGTRG